MRTHGGLTEHSRTDSLTAPIGKGREGNRKGREGRSCVSHASSDLLGRAFAEACELRSEVIR